MPYKVTGKILETETRWGVPNVVVEVWDKDDVGSDDRLGSAVTQSDGSFAILYREEDFRDGPFDRKPDLCLRVRRPDGSPLGADDVNIRSQAGRQESYVIELSRDVLGDLAPEQPPEPQAVAEGDRTLSVQEEEFIEEAIGEERMARKRVALFIIGLFFVAMATVAWYFMNSSESAVAQRIADRWGPAVVLMNTPNEAGSGLIFDKQGHVVTNYHVIDEGGPYTVGLADGRTVQGQIVGVDPQTDLAVLQIDAAGSELIVAPRGDAGAVDVGDLAVAIGNPLGLQRTLTLGHVSAVNRSLQTADPYGAVIDGVIQTDASINPGSSGGPLFNASGKVVGLTTQIKTVSGGSVGLGFAVPINLVERVAQTLITNGEVRRPFLGVKTMRLGSQSPGVQVDFVAGRSAADEAGIRPGDVILSVDGQPVSSPAELYRTVMQHAVGDVVPVTVRRDGEERGLSATLQAYPQPGDALRITAVHPANGGDLNQEWVEVENQGYRTQNLQGDTLKNGSGQAFEFPDFRLAPLERVRIYSGAGESSEMALYWNASGPVWQASTSVVLLGANGKQLDRLAY